MAQHLPVLGHGSLGADGRRRRPYPADVAGRWIRARRSVYVLLVALWASLPWIHVRGRPAVFLDVAHRSFFLFGATFNAQDLWLLFFAVTGFGFGLVVLTTLFGRVWCGWACPQTVFIEAIFRPLERLVNGPRNIALRRAKGPWDADRAWRAALTQLLYFVAALFVAHIFVAYFVSIPELFAMVRARPSAHPEVFAWMLGITALFHVSFGLFREQFCVVMCPYGRLQSILLDDDALVIGYDEPRGEPRGKASATGGDCVDCKRCVVVCPTGIDIRDGLQLDCIACTACIDACDDVMTKLGRKTGLVRYDSTRGLRGEPRRLFRPRLAIYAGLLAVGILVAVLALRHRDPFEANVLRLPGAPYTFEGDSIRNGFELHLVNKTSERVTFELSADPPGGAEVILPLPHVELAPLEGRRVPLFVTMDQARFKEDTPLVVHVASGGVTKEVRATFVGARKASP